MSVTRHKKGIRHTLHEIIFEADTKAGKTFDIVLIISILLSIIVIMLESVPRYNAFMGQWLRYGEIFFTALFTIEYLVRLFCVKKPLRYMFSFFGIIDIISILPTWFALFILPGAQSFAVLRIVRVLRVFRILKLVQYFNEAKALTRSFAASRKKIIVLFIAVFSVVTVLGSFMYLIEGPENGFDSIPRSIYWAIVTLTTVGYGDISPQTPLGQTVAAMIMLLGYSVIAVPAGLVTAELVRRPQQINTQACQACGRDGHDNDALFCKYCGESIQ